MTGDLTGYQRRTSVMVVISSVSTAILLFAVFRFSAELISVKWMGAWSLIQGLLLVARVSDSGAGNNISRVVAVRVKDSTPLQLRNLTLASLLIASAPSVLLTVATAPLVGWYVSTRFSDDLDHGSIWTLVWLATINAAMAATANVLLAICEGVFELNYKSTAIIAGNIVGMVLLFPFLARLGPAGIGLVYAAVTAIQLVFAAIRVVQLIRKDKGVQDIGVRSHLKLLWRENLHLSGIALIRLSFEPATKSLLSLFAPLIVIAQFELALRVTTQVRIVVQSALQPLLVLGAREQADGHVAMRSMFLRNDRILSALALSAVIAQILGAPAIQWLGMGFTHQIFTVFFGVLAIGNALNTMGLSGYYWQLASGSLAPLVRIQSIMAVANLCIGSLGYILRSDVLVVASYSSAFAFGGLAARAFLPGVPRSEKLWAPFLVVVAGAMTSSFVMVIHPRSASALGACFAGGAAIAFACLSVVYITSRRRSN